MRREKGASSVLVLLVLLLLVFLGVLALVTSGSNLILAQKNAETVRAWYRMDAETERGMAEAMQAVKRAYREAKAYTEGQRFLDESQDVVPTEAVLVLKNRWSGLVSESEREIFRADLFPKVYAILSERAFLAMTAKGTSVRPSLDWSDSVAFLAAGKLEHPGPWLHMTVTDPAAAITGFLVAIAEVMPETTSHTASVEIQETTVNGSVDVMGQEGGHLRILQWKKEQDPFVYNNEIKLWEGIVE